ncbi:MAG: glycosyltransferase [Acidimicrobiia bacterium]|nr:glycosyltransferase [Acidimicrobiia bacterium]
MKQGGDASVELSVVVATYNHAPFIGQALDSVLAQQTGRSFEIIISEDDSTDGTRNIVEAFATREPRARLMLSASNMRSNEVIARGIHSARGRYICLLDGDDYWTSPTRLERQAGLLDDHPHVSAWFHNAAICRADGLSQDRWTPSSQPAVVTADDIWHGNPFATCAGMMRASALGDLGAWYYDFFPMTDWPLYVLCAEHGEICFDDEVVGAYRLHEGGLVSALPGRAKLDMIAHFYRRMDEALAFRSHDRARAAASRFFFDWAEVYADSGDRAMARCCLAHSLGGRGVGLSVGWRRWARCAWRLR